MAADGAEEGMNVGDEPRPEYLAAYFTCEPPPGGLPRRFGVVTAHNPDGRAQDAKANEGADAAFELMLEAWGVAHFRVTGRSRDGAHQEPGWGVVTDDIEAVREFSRALRQVAFFWVDDGRVYVVNSEGTRRHPVAAWSERLL